MNGPVEGRLNFALNLYPRVCLNCHIYVIAILTQCQTSKTSGTYIRSEQLMKTSGFMANDTKFSFFAYQKCLDLICFLFEQLWGAWLKLFYIKV